MKAVKMALLLRFMRPYRGDNAFAEGATPLAAWSLADGRLSSHFNSFRVFILSSDSFAPLPEPFLDTQRALDMLGSDASVRAVLRTVVDSLSSDIPKIRQLLAEGDTPSANRLLHAIKGYMPVLGSDRLIDEVTQFERISKQEVAAVVRGLFSELEPMLAQLLVEICSYLDDDEKSARC
jgi:HPt (histidine-containing phosphotransfer) domain-containing protein